MCRCVYVHTLQQKAISHVQHYLPGTWEKHAWAHSYTHTHEHRTLSSHSHPGKSSTLSHIWHVGFAHVQTSTNTLSHFSRAVLALTQSVQGILSQLSFLLHVKQTLTPRAIVLKRQTHTFTALSVNDSLGAGASFYLQDFPMKPRTFTSTNVISTYFCTCDALRSHRKLKKKKKKKDIKNKSYKQFPPNTGLLSKLLRAVP